MPYDEPEPDDPQVLVGVTVPGDAESAREMAGTFADEFARMGFGRSDILALFHDPSYAGAHDALARLGDAEVARLVDESLGVWGHVRHAVEDAPPALGSAADVGLDDSNRFLKVLK
ncbi:MAG: hypothetical protein QGG24_00895 [Vicinamibacterales bacterium]|mgnify:CR=1 FL=1|jgi:hypothetical protein|nr:hypothetical protein [Acidobacteriota bacterium]MDP7293852.1 hypothetical protein [Vicinamibacterales bacterium]MDP7478786.1 hypothetical protein [Vicinamibacterales bacterium]MDP7670371.1 hypothetical protein [Vicinamibacterales bacterium]HJO38028.1 hypothetical protein [Vicinamibacterales bacterium]|tara:strand:- start:694 stop:1041 length:348 start_codon:yes stop_codon:yes gene_type:complete